MRTYRRSLLCLGLILFCNSTGTIAGNDETSGNDMNPKALLYNISTQGAKTVAIRLYADPKSWDYVLHQIATGKESWLKVAVALHPGTDAGSREMLSLAVGEALESSPENVFRIALPEYQMVYICDGPDVDDARYDSYELSMKAIKRRQDRVAAISDPALMTIGKKCLQELERSKSEIAEFYGVRN